ncbi:unnamed protein product [Zymoseptoria tritici ST99CH_1E4]|uniref:Major facilitator superfamily (MFS) profile domain-containing protein n=1 Tax=Zymoseptoria tritici ST99CH_1E4 TaxID=1276532 RepID=A0A2H1GSN8_ZYMTR|nr:unnamed protein product [Zymoseptoria tritici ST99CH_1E4]
MSERRKDTVLYTLVHNPRLAWSGLALALTFFTFGFDGGVISGLLAMPPFAQKYGDGTAQLAPGVPALSSQDQSLLVSVPNSGCLLGLPLAAYLGDRIGRKRTLLVGCVINIAAAILQVVAPNMAAMVIGRWFTNASIFIFITMASTLMAETSPPAIRGIITGLSIVLIDASAILATGVNYAFSKGTTARAYRVPLSIQIIFGFVILVSTLFVSDSPSFFLTKSKDDRALTALRSLRRGYTETEILAEFEDLKAQKAIREETEQVPFKALFQGTDLRRTLLALSIPNMQQMSGIAFATNYVVVFLSTIGSTVSPFVLSMVVALLAFTGAIVGLFLVDKVGRRVLALTSFSALFAINMIVGIMGFLPVTNPMVPKVIAAFCCMFGFFFAVGFGPLTYVVAAEMPTVRLRNRSSSFTFLTLACFATVVTYVLPYIVNKDAAGLGPKTYLIFAGWMAGCIAVIYVYLPETQGRSPAELDEMFGARIPARQFKHYVCQVSVDAHILAEKEAAVEQAVTIEMKE